MTTCSRGMVAVMRAPSAVRSTFLMVSTAGIPAMAAPIFFRALDDLIDDFLRDKGADRVVHQDDVVIRG